MELEQMRTWAEIDLGNLGHNYRALRACAPDSKFLGVVKANAYGHGAIPVAGKLEELGADYLAVACLAEATELREAGIKMPILILGATPPELAEQVVTAGLTQAVSTPELARASSGVDTAWVSPAVTTCSASSGGVAPRIRMGILMPASRSSVASARQATAR